MSMEVRQRGMTRVISASVLLVSLLSFVVDLIISFLFVNGAICDMVILAVLAAFAVISWHLSRTHWHTGRYFLAGAYYLAIIYYSFLAPCPRKAVMYASVSMFINHVILTYHNRHHALTMVTAVIVFCGWLMRGNYDGAWEALVSLVDMTAYFVLLHYIITYLAQQYIREVHEIGKLNAKILQMNEELRSYRKVMSEAVAVMYKEKER